jgi:cytochrome b6-f complex iron-sulfur subunit
MEREMTRRELMGASAALAGCICGCRTMRDAPRSTCCETPDLEPESVTFGPGGLTIDLLKAPSLREVGNAAYLVDQSRSLQLIVVHADKHRYCVLSRLCTHGGQVVSYNRQRRILQCCSFNHSIFDLEGRVWKGPAERPLNSYAVVPVADALVVYL